MRKRSILWFRNDLRLHDNEALHEACRHTEEVIPVYVFDERIFLGKTPFGFPKTGKFRAQFIIDSIKDLRESLQGKGSDLLVRFGKPEDIIFELARETGASWVFCNRERTRDEVQVQDALEKNLWSIGREVRFSRGKMLYYTSDLPFPVTHTPDTFSHFRKEVERYIKVREPLETSCTEFTTLSNQIKPGDIPSLQDLGHRPFKQDPRSVIDFKGGESEGLARLDYYLWQTDLIQGFKDSRCDLMGGDYSTKLSPWISQGCISPKKIYHEVCRYEEERGKTNSTHALKLELLVRDFYRLMGKKHENKIFRKGGIKGEIDPEWQDDESLLRLWIEGRTGVPFIDANMREIQRTGYMSNRGRQNVASFLVNDLQVNWQMGAAYFESMLIDYDPCSNYGNWNTVAGIGSDAKDTRYLNILSQAKRFDSNGEYVKRWIPELKEVPAEKIHRPEILSYKEQEALHVKIGADYPKAMISTTKWA